MPGRRGPRGPELPQSKKSGVGSPAVASAASISANPAILPEVFIEWLPASSPSAADGTWVSMSAYAVSGSTSRGRRYELDQFGAGQARITLQTFDRRFDPDYAAGPYYGQLTPMRQIRVSFKWAGVVYPVFRGFITSWGQTIVADKMFETTITVRDAFERLEQIDLPSSAWALEIVRDNPSAWFRLGESGTVRMTDSSSNGNYGIYDNCQQGQTGLVVNDGDGAASFAHSLEERIVIQNPNLITGFPFTVSMMFQIDNTQPAGSKTMFAGIATATNPTVSSPSVAIYMTAAAAGTPGNIIGEVRDGTTTAGMNTAGRYDDNLPHHLAVVFAGSSTSIYVDGVLDGTRTHSTQAAWPGSPPNGFTIGNYTDLLQGDYGFGANADNLSGNSTMVHRGTIDEVCVWNGAAVSTARIAAHALAAKTGWSGDDTGTRVSRFLDRINWPTALRDISTGASTLGAASWSTGTSALSVLQAWADTELGQFFISKDGKIVWRSRHYPFLNLRSRRPQLTFGDNASTAAVKVDDGSLDMPRDATQIRNPVTASRKKGVTVSVRDDLLADNTYGDRTWASPATEDRDDASVRDRANWLLARYKQEKQRLAGLTVTPAEQPGTWTQILGLEIGDRITVQRTPLGIGSEQDTDQIIEGIDWTFTPFDMRLALRGSPVDPNVGNYLILDDATEGLLDTALLAY